MSPGKPYNARHGVMNAGPLGLLKVNPDETSNKKSSNLNKDRSKGKSPSNNNIKNASFFNDDRLEECERCKLN